MIVQFRSKPQLLFMMPGLMALQITLHFWESMLCRPPNNVIQFKPRKVA
jgi:hypothetical protein